MNELFELLMGRQKQPPSPAAPKQFQPVGTTAKDINNDYMYHPFLQQILPPQKRRGWGTGREADLLDGLQLKGNQTLRPEDSGDYSLEMFDRGTDIFNQPTDIQELLYKIYDQGLNRISTDRAAGKDPYNRIQ